MGAETATLVTTVLGCGVVALVVVLLVLRRRAAVERDRRERLERELATARSDVADLGRRLDSLDQEVAEARRTAAQAVARSQHGPSRSDFVITSLGDDGTEVDAPGPGDSRREFAVRRPGAALEERLVQVATRHADTAPGAAATRLLVRTAALGHGVRRALSPDVLDRAAAEATVARRRSRRDRKREVREARRVLRTVQERPSGKHVA